MTSDRFLGIAAAFLLALLVIATAIHAAGPATTQSATDQQLMQASWENLAKPEPFATRAVLDFAARPALATAFFKAHLKPLKLEDQELDDALRDLDSDDEKVWKPAFEKLEYLDPRLCRGLQKLMSDATGPVQRYRLVAVLCDAPSETYKGKDVKLRSTGGDSYNFFSGNESWWAESKVSRLDSAKGFAQKRQWVRADRAIVILQSFGTPEAVSILKDMATGHPEAQPTKVAKAAVESLDGGVKSPA